MRTESIAGPLPHLIAIVFSLVVVSASNAEPIAKKSVFPGVIGKDDRRVVEQQSSPWTAIGRVNIGGYSRTSHCTGTLITPRMVVTAAHCLVKKGSGKPHSTANIHFLPGARGGRALAHGKAQCVRFAKSYRFDQPDPLKKFRTDVAIIILREPLVVSPAPLMVDQVIGTRLPLQHLGYSRDSRYLLKRDSSCHLRGRQDGLWFTDCDTHFGGSGGPVFIKQNREPVLAAIMVGAIRNKHSVAVPIDQWRNLTAKESCP